MRTLLIDNYDSYTYNLYQLIASVNGAEPTVLRNDDPELWGIDLARFDNIVISPGPGHPERERDFGASARAIADSPVPVLGVCLGHQGIAALSGGKVLAAPKARHGHLTRVRHDGRGLFDGIPQDFTAVRYHSLAVAEPLPPALEATAWSEDGVLMALRHRERPLWGVQFHPESIASEHGQTLLANFRDLTAGRNGAREAVRLAGPARRENPPRDDGRRLHLRTLEREVDGEAAFTALFADAADSFWLDSARVEPGLSRFSFLGDGRGPLAELVSYRVGEGEVRVTGPGGRGERREPGSVLDYLQRRLAESRIDLPELPFDFATGYVGWFGYELKADCGSATPHRAATPTAAWLFADRMLVVDHQERRTYLLALSGAEPDSAADARRWLESVAGALAKLPDAGPLRPLASAQQSEDALAPFMLRDRERYLADVQTCQEHLLAGESYEICLTNAARIDQRPGDGSCLDFYRRLRRLNPAPYAAYLRLAGVDVACSSPERFLKIDRPGNVETKPIKGTVRRGATAEEDGQLRESLAASEKTFAENLMIVDLMRNDLGRVCDVGSVHVPRLMATETYTTVHQLVSTVRGTLRPDVDAIDCVRACFPGGSMTGAPKLRTMEIIDGLETHARGVYSGAIGFLGCNGTADLNIVIRTAVLADGVWHIGAGGAIVLASDPEEEYQEMVLKAMASLRAHTVFAPAEATR
jgi:para-aminobenzoate synthetase